MNVTLNCDMGEGYGNWRFGDDVGIMPFIDCANIACGFHAGDPMTMMRAVDLAAREGKRIGAHPSLPDREGFGRRELRLSPEELRAAFIYQIGALTGVARAVGKNLSHVKPHGIIYGMAARDMALATAMAEAAKTFDLPLFGMAGTFHESAANAVGAHFVPEFFADLSYGPAGELIIPRTQSAVDIEKAAARLDRAVREGKVEAVDGTLLNVSFQTVCIHSDPPNARDVAAAMRRVLDTAQR
ncbi:lactam utilization protein LamB [Bradyrhizobium ottawaense]|uniref:5-oxoprolinase subunit PxpA n=1 Tax=Bradyrhizobium ottawaense TaxID=931866 RepID=UPI000BE99D25|nr:5-oxoprolinase subunit PxpA [Bradyrhizobium ottawaense]PDT64499.1 lactam utilization protein LamB [Bradyrhizobium ottawaense]